MHKRALLIAALGGMVGLPRHERLEAAVNDTFLYYDILDDDRFPELKPGPGRKGIQARVIQPPGDPRIPAKPQGIPLLVVFRLDEPPQVMDPDLAPPGWQLGYDVPSADGQIKRHTILMRPMPKDGNYSQRPIPDPNLRPLPGAIYRGALWTDVAALYAQKVFRSGMVIEIAYMQQAQTRVPLP